VNLIPQVVRNFFKAAPPHPGGGTGGTLPFLTNVSIDRADADFAKRVGTGMNSSVVMATVQWIQRAMQTAPALVEQRQTDGDWEKLHDHPMSVLLDSPNDFYAGSHLLSATVLSYLTDGNAYWFIVPNNAGRPVDLWYVPHWLIRPIFPRDGSEFISFYEYTPGGQRLRVERENVVHFRHGLDPKNIRLGVSPLISALAEIWTDMEAATFIANLLGNSGVPGLLITPKGDTVPMGAPETETMKQYVKERTTGRFRGEPLILNGATVVQQLAWDPQQMDLTAATDRAEERVTALLGIPATVVGFSAGLETSDVGSTMKARLNQAWTNGVIPLQDNLADTLARQLLPQFGSPAGKRVQFDRSEVAALQEDQDKIWARVGKAVNEQWLSVADAQRMAGMDALPGGDVYLRRLATVEVPVGSTRAGPEEPKSGTKGAEDAFEQRIAATSPRAEATDGELAFISFQEAHAPALEGKMRKALLKFFADLGDRAEEAALPFLEESLKLVAPEDAIMAAQIQEAMAMDEVALKLAVLFSAHYILAAEESTAPAMATIGLATGIPDDVGRAIQATGGTRAGLVDLSTQTRKALFAAIEEGRAAGEGADALARRIRGMVGAGPWKSPEIRARIIARTETKHAQRMSAVIMGKDQGVTEFRVFDARLGLTDAECESLDGILVDARTADELASAEHPNGTRDFVPHFG